MVAGDSLQKLRVPERRRGKQLDDGGGCLQIFERLRASLTFPVQVCCMGTPDCALKVKDDPLNYCLDYWKSRGIIRPTKTSSEGLPFPLQSKTCLSVFLFAARLEDLFLLLTCAVNLRFNCLPSNSFTQYGGAIHSPVVSVGPARYGPALANRSRIRSCFAISLRPCSRADVSMALYMAP
jgi:hypothetical protein